MVGGKTNVDGIKSYVCICVGFSANLAAADAAINKKGSV